DASNVVGIGVDSTGSTPLPVDEKGVPLSFDEKFADNPNAYAWLWKDHTSFAEADKITKLAEEMKLPYLEKCGGTYSSEWFWAKIWHCLNIDKEVFDAAYSWVELSDFVPAYITDNCSPHTMKRNVCAAGHKALYSEEWGGLPSVEFLGRLSPRIAELRSRLYKKAVPSDQLAGHLSEKMAEKVGLPAGVPVAVGGMDCHHGAVGSGIKPGTLVKIIGTSTCDALVAPKGTAVPDIPGVCGIVPGSIIPDMIGIEAGQSAVGDIFKWFVEKLVPAEYTTGNVYANLEKAAIALRPGESGLLALDWNNGNRCILVDPLLTGMIIGMSLHTAAPEIYRALVEATAFGAMVIVERVEEYNIKINEVITCGGLAEKSPFMMQIYADVLNRPIRISRSAQSCALGAAIFGALSAGEFGGDMAAAQESMTGTKDHVFEPIADNVKVYGELYKLYKRLHDAFGLQDKSDSLGDVMKELISIRIAVRSKDR
ncbi:MAG: ribulokinase, partial [Lentisphaerae bacterium]|nr:ribulokinase [Lentisphaerota bacterium]